MGTAAEASFRSYRSLLTPLTYFLVGNIDIETCRECGGAVRVIACIEEPEVIKKILTHLTEKASSAEAHRLPESRAPPQAGLFD